MFFFARQAFSKSNRFIKKPKKLNESIESIENHHPQNPKRTGDILEENESLEAIWDLVKSTEFGKKLSSELTFSINKGKTTQEIFSKQLNIEHLNKLQAAFKNDDDDLNEEDFQKPLSQKGKKLHKAFTEAMDDPKVQLKLLNLDIAKGIESKIDLLTKDPTELSKMFEEQLRNSGKK